MAFIEAQAVRAVLALVLAAAVVTGVAFAGYAGFLALAGVMAPWTAAAIVAAVLLAVVLVAAFVVRGRARQAQPQAAAQQNPEAAAVAMIANLARRSRFWRCSLPGCWAPPAPFFNRRIVCIERARGPGTRRERIRFHREP